MPAGQMSFLPEAWMQIVKCRRVLKWTYAYGFYLTDDNATRHDFFEHVQVRQALHGLPASSGVRSLGKTTAPFYWRRMRAAGCSLLCNFLERWLCGNTHIVNFFCAADVGQPPPPLSFAFLQGEAEKALGWLHKSAEKDVERFLPCRYRSASEEEPMEMNPTSRMEEFVAFRSSLTRLTAVTRKYFENLMNALEGGLADISMPESMGATEVVGKGKGKVGVDSPDDNRKRRRGGAEGVADGLELSLGLSRQAGGEASTSAGSALGRVSEEEERWSCVHCTYSNLGMHHQCRMCTLPRQAEGV